MKGKRGREKDSGVLSGIDPQRESLTDICNRIIYDSAEWPLVRLRNFLRQASERLPDNFVSIVLNVIEELMTLDQDGNLVPRLATHWQ